MALPRSESMVSIELDESGSWLGLGFRPVIPWIGSYRVRREPNKSYYDPLIRPSGSSNMSSWIDFYKTRAWE
jgi:hypothetical protein